MKGLLNLLDWAAESKLARIFWPSSIAVFGPGSGRVAAQTGYRLPKTVYGISKNAGEHWCAWYRRNRGVDVRSVRYPGLIGTLAPPGGGTTDYAVEVFDYLSSGEPYPCFIAEDERLPMMHMDDAVRAALELMSAPREPLQCEEAYNIQALSFSPRELFAEIEKQVPGFQYRCIPDFRQDIASGWPDALDDAAAQKEWGWRPQVDLTGLVTSMIKARMNKPNPVTAP
jgi:nucleoside-diphosphate-sugar epimerase